MEDEETNTCAYCVRQIEQQGTDDMGMCDDCLELWWRHADDPHECSWGCVADFRDYQPEGV